MSDQLSAAAAALNAPETIVQRSAEARAKATGTSIDDILAAWAGGGSAPAAPPPASEPAPAPEPDTTTQPAAEPAAETPTAPAPTAPAPATESPAAAPAATTVVAPARPAEPPILEGRTDRPFLATIGAVAALALSLVAGLFVASTPEEGNGVYTSAVPLDAQGEHGRTVYLELGCGACHTQVVRPLVTDAALGGVTISDSNQVLGVRRFGPDLTDVASRVESASMFASVLAGEGGHPAYTGLSDDDVAGLVAYLSATNAVPTDEETDS